MKSMVSREALHKGFELANSKFPDPFFIESISLKPLPSSIFFFTLASGFGGYFLASAPGNLPPHELRKMEDKIKIKVICLKKLTNFYHLVNN